MAPKRKQPASAAAAAAASKSQATAPKQRRSKLAKENDISAEEEAEIQEAFHLFAREDSESGTQVIKDVEVRRCLIALDCAPSSREELQELTEIADSEGTGLVDYEHFLPIAALKVNQRKYAGGGDEEAAAEMHHAEVEKAFRLFTKGEERDINLHDLRRIAKDLREDVPDEILRDMIREASGGGLSGVGMDDFEGVMRRAGVF